MQSYYFLDIEENKTVQRKIGDKWTDEDGNEYEQKDGYVCKYGKANESKGIYNTVIFSRCPKEECACINPNKVDLKMASKMGMCLNCTVEKEHEMKLDGTYDLYEAEKMYNNALAHFRDTEIETEAIIRQLSKAEFVNGRGVVLEKWENCIPEKELRNKLKEELDVIKEKVLEPMRMKVEEEKEKLEKRIEKERKEKEDIK